MNLERSLPTRKHPGTYSDWNEDQKAAFAEHWEHIDCLNSGSGYDWGCLDVWRRKSDGKLVWDTDSGCSCNGPYEYSDDESDLVEIDNWIPFRDSVLAWVKDDYEPPSAHEVGEFLDKVRRALHG